MSADGTPYDPLQQLLEVFADVKSVKTVKEDRSGWPVEERLKHRIIDGERDGLTAELDEAMDGGLQRARTSSTRSCSTGCASSASCSAPARCSCPSCCSRPRR